MFINPLYTESCLLSPPGTIHLILSRRFSFFKRLVIKSTPSFGQTIIISEKVNAGSYDGQDLAYAILADPSTLISSQYTDTDRYGHRQEAVLSSLGTMSPTNGSTFALLSTGIAGTSIITTNAHDPGDERGTWFGKSHPKTDYWIHCWCF